jgi:hypothetical protein
MNLEPLLKLIRDEGYEFRAVISHMLKAEGYHIVESSTCISDPFEWYIIAKKDEYEVRVQERCASLL